MADQSEETDQVFRRLSEIFTLLSDLPTDSPERPPLETERIHLKRSLQALTTSEDRRRPEHRLRAELAAHRRRILEIHDNLVRRSEFSERFNFSSRRRDGRYHLEALNDEISDAGGIDPIRQRVAEILEELHRRGLQE